MKFLAYIFILFMVVSCNSQIARLSGSQSTNSVEKDKTHLIIYPWNRSDTLNYADLRFLRLVPSMLYSKWIIPKMEKSTPLEW